MPGSGEHHGNARRIGRGNDIIVPDRSPRLDDCRHARLDCGQEAVRQGEKGVGSGDRAHGKRAGAPSASPASAALRTAMRLASRRDIWPAPMPTVAPSRARTIAFDFTCLAMVKANSRSERSAAVGGPSGYHAQFRGIENTSVGRLDKKAAGDAAHLGGPFPGKPAGKQQAQVFFRRHCGHGSFAGIGRDNDFGEQLRDLGAPFPHRAYD